MKYVADEHASCIARYCYMACLGALRFSDISNTCVPFVKARKSSIVLGGECDVYEIIRQIIVEVLRANYNILRHMMYMKLFVKLSLKF